MILSTLTQISVICSQKILLPSKKTNVDALNIKLSQQKNQTQTPTPAAVYQDNGDTSVKYYMYVVNVANSIYLRSQPVENDSNIIKTIPLGAQVGYISNCGNGFYKIMHNGNIGYAKQMYLSSYQTTSSGSGDLTVVNVAHSIYLRSEPVENSSNIICEIPVGSKVKFVSGGTGEFYKISWNGYTGYAKSMYLRW